METWVDVKGWTGMYEISNMGNVRSCDRHVYNKGNKSWYEAKGKILKPTPDRGSYLYVGFYSKQHKKTSSLKIHKLVAIAFCDGYEIGLEVNHKDGNRQNNKASNLEWVTRSQNIRDTYKRGRNTNGDKNNASKLKNTDIGVITSLYDSGVTQSIISKAYGVSQATISNIIKNKHYRNGLITEGLAIDINTL